MFHPSLFPEDLDHVLANTRDLWDELRGKRLFLSGGTGYFGIWLLESFLWANERLDLRADAMILTRDPVAFSRRAPHVTSQAAIHLHAGDVKDFAFPDGEFLLVIHAATAASAQMNEEQPLEMLDVTVAGTRRVLDFAVGHGARKLLFTSSGAVYGSQPVGMTHVAEDYQGGPDPLAATSAYGEGKRVSELLCRLYAKRYPVEMKIARCFAQVGPYLPLNIHYAMGNFLRDALAGGPIVVQGDGSPYRSYMYAADLAIWLWTMLFRAESCRPYNVGSDEGLDLADLARRIGRVTGDVAVHTVGTPVPGRPAPRYVPSIDRARRELHLDIYVRLEEAVRRTMRFYGAEPVFSQTKDHP